MTVGPVSPVGPVPVSPVESTPPALTLEQEARLLKDCVLACIVGKNKISQTSNLWKRARGIPITKPEVRATNIKNALRNIINMNDEILASYGIFQGTGSYLKNMVLQPVRYFTQPKKTGGTHRRRYKKKNRTHRRR